MKKTNKKTIEELGIKPRTSDNYGEESEKVNEKKSIFNGHLECIR